MVRLLVVTASLFTFFSCTSDVEHNSVGVDEGGARFLRLADRDVCHAYNVSGFDDDPPHHDDPDGHFKCNDVDSKMNCDNAAEFFVMKCGPKCIKGGIYFILKRPCHWHAEKRNGVCSAKEDMSDPESGSSCFDQAADWCNSYKEEPEGCVETVLD